MEIDCIRRRSEEERRESVKAVIDVAFSLSLSLSLSLSFSLSLWHGFATLHDSSSESETFNPLHPRHSACALINIKDHFQF